jgi:hypothetical protein
VVRGSVTVLLLTVFTGCETGDSQGTLTYQSDTLPNGTVRVENNGSPAWTEEDRWEAREILRIGTLDDEGPEQFGNVTGLAVGEDGAIFVAELYSNQIRVFRRDGTFSHAFGGKGEGPEEFRGIFGMRFDPDGTLWVRDTGNNRFSAFTPAGTLLRSFSPGFFSRYLPWQFRILDGERFLDWDIRRPRDADAESRTEIVFFPVLSPLDLSSRDTLPPIKYRQNLIAGMRASKPFSGKLEYFVDETGGIWFGNSEEYRIYRRDMSGDTTLVFMLPAVPENVSEEEKLARVDSWLQGRKTPIDQMLDEKPVLERIITDDEEHVLVFPHLEGVPRGSAVDVFSEGGVFLGRVELPVVLELRPEPVSRGGILFGITKDEFDVPYVVALNLKGGRE